MRGMIHHMPKEILETSTRDLTLTDELTLFHKTVSKYNSDILGNSFEVSVYCLNLHMTAGLNNEEERVLKHKKVTGNISHGFITGKSCLKKLKDRMTAFVNVEKR